jgi:hypothetical protein
VGARWRAPPPAGGRSRPEGDAALAALFAGAEWWEPEEEAAIEAVREAVTGEDRGGDAAHVRIAAQLSWQRATERLLAALDTLEEARVTL